MIPDGTQDVVAIPKQFSDCLCQQLSELELLKSMYSKHGEITLFDQYSTDEIQKFIDEGGDSEYIPNNLEYVINLVIDNLKLEVCVNLPVMYPNEEPNINIRCNQLNRQQESRINKDLSLYIKTYHIGEVCIYTAITWLQDNMATIVMNQKIETVNNSTIDEVSSVEEPFTRFWIYSHHIYNKKKREVISKMSKDLKLTGFFLSGKPGIVCIEGDESACKEYWQCLKSMNWKKIMIRKMETFECSEKSQHCKFNNFEELHFQSSSNTKHANMSEFSKFMSKHGFSDIFSELFGFNE